MTNTSLLLLYEAQKYKDIVSILRVQDTLTEDEHNFKILAAIKYGLKFDYVQELSNSVATELFPDINLFKSYVYNRAIELGLLPDSETFIGLDKTVKPFYLPSTGNVAYKNGTNSKYDFINVLFKLAKEGSPYIETFINSFDYTLLNSEDLYSINDAKLSYSINSKNLDYALDAISYFATLSVLNRSTKNVIRSILPRINEELGRDIALTKRVEVETILGITDAEYDEILLSSTLDNDIKE